MKQLPWTKREKYNLWFTVKNIKGTIKQRILDLDEWDMLKTFIHYIVECEENK